MKIAVTCPAYVNNWNHRDFLNKTTESIKTTHGYIWIPVFNFAAPQFLPYVWHFSQHPTEIHILEGRQPQCVARGWNDGIKKAGELGCDYVVVINDDIVLKSNAIDNLIEHAQSHPEAVLWSMGGFNDLFGLEQAVDNPEDFHEHPNFSSFMVKPSILDEVGLFDENFVPAYHEDCDYAARIALANKKAYVTGYSWFFHFGSRTTNVDEDLRAAIPPQFRKGAAYFREKWGSGIVNEPDQMRQTYYQHPYNESDKPLSYWRKPDDAI